MAIKSLVTSALPSVIQFPDTTYLEMNSYLLALSTASYFLCLSVGVAGAAPMLDTWSVLDFGAKADGKTDDTSAFQKALDAAGQAGGGQVYAPRGNYFFSGHLNVPNAVTLKGMWESVPSHVGIRDRGSPKPTDAGTSFLVTENK